MFNQWVSLLYCDNIKGNTNLVIEDATEDQFSAGGGQENNVFIRDELKMPGEPGAELLQSLPTAKELESYIMHEKNITQFYKNKEPSDNEAPASKKSYNYLFIDPQITAILHGKEKLTKEDIWQTFIKSIFYIGKGTGKRPYDHFSTAKASLVKLDTEDREQNKIQEILRIWERGEGVICIQIFHNVHGDEAHTYEAAMIDAIGINYLTNIKHGSYKIQVEKWSDKEYLELGIILLIRALMTYLFGNRRQVRPENVMSKAEIDAERRKKQQESIGTQPETSRNTGTGPRTGPGIAARTTTATTSAAATGSRTATGPRKGRGK